MDPIPVLFCGTPEFALPTLDALFNDPRYQIRGVLSQPDRPSGRGQKLQPSPVKKRALELGLEVRTPEKASGPEIHDWIQQLGPQVGVVVAYGQILSQKFLDGFPLGCVNIHSSLLPRWRGAAPMQRAIMAGDPTTGVSLQKVVKKLDAGPIIGEASLELGDEMGATELTQRLSQMGAELLLQSLEPFVKGQIQPKEQDESLVTYAAKIEKSEGLIQWSKPCHQIHNQVRGLDMGGPFAYTLFNDKNLKIHKTRPYPHTHNGSPGQVVEVFKDHFVVACGEGALEIWQLQPESKARMSAADFIRGYHLKQGVQFG
jgi:methionyl-tRNA formyltransferase